MTTLYLVFIVFSCSAFSAAIGFGGGALLLALLTFFFPIETTLLYHAIVQLAGNTFRFLIFRKAVNFKVILFYTLGLLLSLYWSKQLFYWLDSKKLGLAIGVILLLSLFKLKPEKNNLNLKLFVPIGLVIGLIAPSVGAIGPLTTRFFLQANLTGASFIGTKSASNFFVHLSKLNIYDLSLLTDSAVLISSLILATLLGSLVGKKLVVENEKKFILIAKVFLTISALLLIKNNLY